MFILMTFGKFRHLRHDFTLRHDFYNNSFIYVTIIHFWKPRMKKSYRWHKVLNNLLLADKSTLLVLLNAQKIELFPLFFFSNTYIHTHTCMCVCEWVYM